jgi:hypothetical protein
MVSRSDVPLTTHTNAQLGPVPTAALAFWQIGPFLSSLCLKKLTQGGRGNREQKGQEVSVPFPKVPH